MNNDTSSQNCTDVLNDEELERKADVGEPLSPDELALLVSYGRCPTCGKRPEAESGYLGCVASGFHQHLTYSEPVTQQEISPVLQAAFDWYDIGCNPAPAREDGTKGPALDQWTERRTKRNRREDLPALFAKATGLGIFLGRVFNSTNTGYENHKIECFEFDSDEALDSFLAGAEAAGLSALTNRVRNGYEERTPSGGVHWFYFCETVEGSQKLAQEPTDEVDDKGNVKRKTLIETKGPGGWVITSPSYGGVHPTGKPYVRTQGGPATIPTLTEDERAALLAYGRTFDRILENAPSKSARRTQSSSRARQRIQALFNKHASWDDVLIPHGWQRVGEANDWRRPGAETNGTDATTDADGTDRFWVHSTSTSFEIVRYYTKFQAYAVLNHAGDRAAAESDLQAKWESSSGTFNGEIRNDIESQNIGSDEDSGSSSAFSASSAEQTKNSTVEPAPQFPIEVLPPVSRQFVEQGARAIGVPPEMVAIPFLANAAAAIGNTRDIEIKGGYVQSANLFAAVIAQTGTAKTPAQAYAQKPLNALQADAFSVYMKQRAAHEEKVREAKKKKDAQTSLTPPQEEHFLSTDATVEALGQMLATSRGVLLTQDELSGFMASMDAYRKGGDRQSYLTLWNGQPLRINRKGSGTSFIPYPAVSIIGGIQPELLSSLADKENQRDGFIPRFLMVMPDARALRWNDYIIEQGPIDAITKVFRRLRNPQGYTGGTPETLPLSDEALSVFRDWHEENQSAVDASSGLERGFLAKYPNQLGRLTLILHLLTEPDDLTGPVEADTVRDAITLIEYFRASLTRILPEFKATATRQSAGLIPRLRRILEKAEGEWVDRTRINSVLSGHVRAEAITDALEALKDQGLAESQSVTTGGRPKEQWRYIPPPQNPRAEKAKKAEELPTGAEAIVAEPHRPFGTPMHGSSASSPLLDEE